MSARQTNNTASRMNSITEAVVLMAGSGSRFRVGGRTLMKPLIPVRGRPLITYTFDALARAGVRTVYAVVGFESETLIAEMQASIPQNLCVSFIHNKAWQKQNGISVLAASPHLTAPFFLTMCDHLFDPSLVELLRDQAVMDQLNLAIDRKVETIFDLDDAMKVQTDGDRLVAIGKNLPNYDAIDTGVFLCTPNIFDYLERAKRNDDCSLADGVRLMAIDAKVRAVDIGNAWWQDIDTPEMLRHAESKVAALL